MAKARSTDPKTSHDAAESVSDITATKAHILEALKRPRSDAQLIEAYRNTAGAPKASESGIRSRRAELVDSGMVVDSGDRVKTESGRWSIVWQRAIR